VRDRLREQRQLARLALTSEWMSGCHAHQTPIAV
jgi:hypothetical protein